MQCGVLKSNEDMILALAGQFKQLSHEPEKFRSLNGIRTQQIDLLSTVLLGGQKSQSYPEKSDVNQIKKYERTPVLSNVKTKSCGRDDHLANGDKCRAKGAECRKCKKIGHCAKYCRLSGAEKEERKVKAVQQTCQDTDENHHEYFASKEGGIDFIYEPGTGNIADGLSRLPVTSAETEEKSVEEHVKLVKKDTVHCYPLRRSRRLERKTEKVVITVKEGWNESDES